MTQSAEYISLLNKLAGQMLPKANLESRGFRVDLNLKKLKSLSKATCLDSLIKAYSEDFNAVTLAYDRTSKQPSQAASNTYQPKIANVSGVLTLYDGVTNKPVKLKQLSLRGLGHKFDDGSGITFDYLLANIAQPPSEFDINKEADLLQLLSTPTRYLKNLPVGEYKVVDWVFSDKGYKKSRIVELNISGQGIVLGNGDLTKSAQAYQSSWDRKQPATLNITGHGLTKTGNVIVKAFLNLPSGTDDNADWSILDALSMDDDILMDTATILNDSLSVEQIPF
jgi:hypothetical protein